MASTVSELSRLTGFSTATVSRVLNNSAFVSAEKREVVLRAIRETSYLNKRRRGRRLPSGGVEAPRAEDGLTVEIVQHRHSPVERVSIEADRLEVGGLVKANSSSMLRNSPLSNSFYRHILDGAVEELAAWGARAQLSFNDDLLAPDFLARITTPARNGVLLLGEPSVGLPSFLAQCVHPVVLLDLPGDGMVDVVTIDNHQGISLAFDHLYGLGHRKIGFVGRLDENFAYAERFTTFKWKMAEAGLPVRDDWSYAGHTQVDASAARMREVLAKEDRPTALLCSNDWVALGAVRAASDLGISVPDQLSIIGFDGIEAAAIVTPPLTTVHVPVEEIGRRGVRQLMIQMKQPQRDDAAAIRGCRIRLEGELVVRGSTGPAPR